MSTNYNSIYNQLIDLGYYVGTFEDFYDLGVTPDQILRAANTFKSTVLDLDKVYMYRHNYIDQDDASYLNIPGYMGPTPAEEDKTQEIIAEKAGNRKQFVKDIIAAGAKHVRTTQQWYRLSIGNYDNVDKNKSNELYTMYNFFDSIFKAFTANVYIDMYKDKRDELRCASQYSIYKSGDFSELHFDGINPGRACVIILYFADPDTYHDGDGGELRIKHDHVDTKVKPIYGNYAMLDFTKWNIGHSIEMVHNNFIRFALQSFVGIY